MVYVVKKPRTCQCSLGMTPNQEFVPFREFWRSTDLPELKVTVTSKVVFLKTAKVGEGQFFASYARTLHDQILVRRHTCALGCPLSRDYSNFQGQELLDLFAQDVP